MPHIVFCADDVQEMTMCSSVQKMCVHCVLCSCVRKIKMCSILHIFIFRTQLHKTQCTHIFCTLLHIVISCTSSAQNTMCGTSSAHYCTSSFSAHVLDTTLNYFFFNNILQLISFATEGNFGHIETLKLQEYFGRFIINQ